MATDSPTLVISVIVVTLDVKFVIILVRPTITNTTIYDGNTSVKGTNFSTSTFLPQLHLLAFLAFLY